MRLTHVAAPAPSARDDAAAVATLAAALRRHVDALAVPRHAEAQPEANRAAARYVADALAAVGYAPTLQGPHRNVVALPARAPASAPLSLVCAHYDSVPATPGADDNASAVAVMLEVARALAGRDELALGFIAFNGEEDNLVGSRDFVARRAELLSRPLAAVHVLEMLGFTDARPGSQRRPPGMELDVPDVGDFIAVLANEVAADALDAALSVARADAARPDNTQPSAEALANEAAVIGAPPLVALRAGMLEARVMPDILRSDHAPFWARGLPALMWTDTANFRNPHYHQPSDTPDTLDYAFMARVTSLLVRTVVAG